MKRCIGTRTPVVFSWLVFLSSPFAFLPRTAAPSATSRLLLHDKIHDEVMEKVLKRTATVSVGDPLRDEGDKSVPGSFMGPLVSGPQRDKVLGFISRVSCALEIIQRRRPHHVALVMNKSSISYFLPPAHWFLYTNETCLARVFNSLSFSLENDLYL